MRRLYPLVVCLVVIALASGFFASVSAKQPVTATEKEPRVMVMDGEGLVQLKPDRAVVTLGVQTQAETAQKAQSENARLMQQVIAAVKSLGIRESDMKTAGFNLFPVWDYQPEKEGSPRVIGFRVHNTLSITVYKIDIVGRILDTAVSAGANSVEGVQFSVKDPSAARLEALKLAMADAKTKAETVASTIGATVTDVLVVEENYSESPGIIRYSAAKVMEDTAILPGDMIITARLRVKFSF
ncbi:MAG: SIMPL domain-containing protein [Bacillota bacterium]